MLAPYSKDFRRLIESRIPGSSIGDPLSTSTKIATKSLIDRIISIEESLEQHRRKMKSILSFNSRKIFELIGGYASSFFSESDVRLYFNILAIFIFR